MNRLLLRIGIVAVAIIAIVLGTNAYFVWRNGARLESQLAELRAAGDPISLKDLARAPIPPEKNAATYLRRAQADLEAVQKELAAAYPETGYPTGPLSPAEQEKLQKVFDAYPKVIPLLEQAAACPDYDPQLDYTVPARTFMVKGLDEVQKSRVPARFLRATTTLLVAKGRRDEALARMVLLLRLCRHFDHHPMLTGCLLALACRGYAISGANLVLQSGPIGKEAREALERELSRHDGVQAYVGGLKTERAFGLDMFDTMPWSQNWLGRAFDYAGKSCYLDMMHEYLEAASRPYCEVQPAKPVAEGWPRFVAPYKTLVELVRPALDAARSAMERNRAMVRAVRLLNALQAKVAPDAKDPPKLSDLGLPAEATIDPFNGQPLHVKKLPQGWLVYSVGENIVDDGGVLGSDPKTSDIGVGPPDSERKAEKK